MNSLNSITMIWNIHYKPRTVFNSIHLSHHLQTQFKSSFTSFSLPTSSFISHCFPFPFPKSSSFPFSTSSLNKPIKNTLEQNQFAKIQSPSSSLFPSIPDFPPTSAYIHIPFCRKRCHYCDFPILPVGNLVNGLRVQEKMENYVNILCKEIRALHSSLSTRYSDELLCNSLRTVYIGGGTPSLISSNLLARVLETLRETFGLVEGSEISIEMDPGTFDRTKLREFLGLGITRASLGVQVFDDDLLKVCGRSHSLNDVYNAIELISTVGLNNWSLDLISSLPNQNMRLWKKSLSEAILAKPTHISVYDLQIEEGTAFGRRYKPNVTPLPSDSEAAEMYREASAQLSAAGYLHYELSNYAKPGFESKHNLVYWRNASYYGFGLGAASYFLGRRFSRPKSYSAYLTWAENFASNCGEFEAWPLNSDEDLVLDTLMLGLRLAEGIDLVRFSKMFGFEKLGRVLDSLTSFVGSGHVLFVDSGGKVVDGVGLGQFWKFEENMETLSQKYDVSKFRLKDPEGFLLSNEIISTIFLKLC